jgi:hypothetical protein
MAQKLKFKRKGRRSHRRFNKHDNIDSSDHLFDHYNYSKNGFWDLIKTILLLPFYIIRYLYMIIKGLFPR